MAIEAKHHDKLYGGNPMSYWKLPFNERYLHHLPEGIKPEKCFFPAKIMVVAKDEGEDDAAVQ